MTGALFLAWMFRARAMATTLRDESETGGDAWVTLGWLPLVNLAVPFMLTAELYRDSDRELIRGRASESGRPWLVAAWAIPTLMVAIVADLRVSFSAAQPIRFFAARLPQSDLAWSKGSVIVDVIALAALTLSAALAAAVVQKITRRLWDRCEPPAPAVAQQALVSAS